MKKTYKKKRLARAIICLCMTIVIATSFITPAFATDRDPVPTVISNVSPQHLFDVPDQPYYSNGNKFNCTNISGIGIGKSKNRLFVVKSHDAGNISDAAFYYYPNMDNPSNKRVFRLKYAGHANAMAVDNSYVYITASTSTNDPNYPHANNDNCIIRIARSLITSLSDGDTINYSDYTSFEPIAEESGVYSSYTENISMITKYNNNGKFIINFEPLATASTFAFTTAEIKTVGGQEKFVVSKNCNDIFLVNKNLLGTHNNHVDICYAPSCGLFVPIWGGSLSSPNRNKNIVLWVNNVNGTCTNVSTDFGTCRCYSPRQIHFTVSSLNGNNVTKFEMESIAFTLDNEFIFSANITCTNQTKAINDKDGIFALHYNDTSNPNFLLTNYEVFV